MPEYMSVNQGFPGGFTVLMAVCGKDDHVLFTKALTSIFANDLQPDKMVLVVDGPIPGILDKQVVAAGRDHAVEIIRLARNKGLATALNAGLAHIQTTWMVRADADDYNLPWRFRRLAEFVRTNPEIDLVGSAVLELEGDGTPLAVRELPAGHNDILRFIRRRNPFNHMTIACRLTLVESCGGYPDIYRREDYALWAKLVKAGARCANLTDVLVNVTAGTDLYRRRGGLRYVIAEWDLQKILVQLGLKTRLQGLFDGAARSSVFIAPVFVRRLFYKIALRRPPVTRS